MQDESNGPARLYRSQNDRYLGGVCGGLAVYFNIDSNLCRLLFALSTFAAGLGIWVYIAALIVVPENPRDAVPEQAEAKSFNMWGAIFLGLGLVLLFRELDIFDFFYFADIPWSTIWALFLIGIGGALIYHQSKQPAEGEDSESTGKSAFNFDIHRSVSDRKIAGICGGLAKHFNIDSSLIRLGWILATFASAGLGIALYLLFIFIMPEESSQPVV